MAKNMKPGDFAYIEDNRYGLCKVKITKIQGGLYTIKLVDKECAYRVPEHRLISEEEYKQYMEQRSLSAKKRNYIDFMLTH